MSYSGFTALFYVCILSLVLFCQFNTGIVHAQVNPGDDEDLLKIEFIKGSEIDNRNENWHSIDSSLSNFHRFDTGSRQFPERMTGGNSGQKLFSLTPPSVNTETGFRHGFDQFEDYRYTFDNTRFFDTYTPFSEIDYVQGQDNLQFGRGSYSRSVTSRMNIGFDLERHRSEGFYFNQEILHTKGRLYTRYISLDRRYRLFFSGNWNRFDAEKNGGIMDELDFENALAGDKPRSQVNLDDASSRWDDKNLTLYQSYSLGESFKDTLKDEDTSWVTNHFPEWEVFLQSSFTHYQMDYEDPNPPLNFYSDYHGLTTDILDSVVGSEVQNQAGIQSGPYAGAKNDSEYVSRNWFLKAAVENTYHDYLHNDHENSFLNTGGLLEARYSLRSFSVGVKGNYIFDGFLEGNRAAAGNIDWQHAKSRLFASLNLKYNQSLPDYNLLHFESHGFFWNNKFQKEERSGAILQLGLKDWLEWKGEALQFSNFVYYNDEGRPFQHAEIFNVFRSTLSGKLDYNGFRLRGLVGYQHNENQNVLRIPPLFAEAEFSYKRTLFDEALTAKLGVEGRFFSSYEADTYLPYAGSSKKINDGRSIGNYPYLDAFFSARVQQVRLFARYDHFNASLTGDRYFIRRNYPQHPAAFRLGLNWRFFD